MPPPLAVIWRTWPQILSPLTIWAVLSWLQGGHSFRSCCTPQVCLLPAKVRLPESRFAQGRSLLIPYLFETLVDTLLYLQSCVICMFFTRNSVGFTLLCMYTISVVYIAYMYNVRFCGPNYTFCQYTISIVYIAYMYNVRFCGYTFTMVYITYMYNIIFRICFYTSLYTYTF